MKADRFPFSAVGASSSSHDDDDRRHRRRRPTSRTLYAALVSLLLASLLILWKLDSVLAVTCSTSAVSRQTRLCLGYRVRPATVGPPADDRETARLPSLDGWLEIEREVAWRGILDNMCVRVSWTTTDEPAEGRPQALRAGAELLSSFRRAADP
jgi:hypothetical protein